MKSVDIKVMLGIVLAMLAFGMSCADEAEEPPICEPRVFEPVQHLPVDLLGDWQKEYDEDQVVVYFRYTEEMEFNSVLKAGVVTSYPPRAYKLDPEVTGVLYTSSHSNPPRRVALVHKTSVPEYILFELTTRMLPVTCPDSLFDLESPAIPLPEGD